MLSRIRACRSRRRAGLREFGAGAHGGPPARERRNQGRVAPGEGFGRGLDAGRLVELLRKLPRGGGKGRDGCHELIAAPEQGLKTALSMLWRRRRERQGIIRRASRHRCGESKVKFRRAEG